MNDSSSILVLIVALSAFVAVALLFVKEIRRTRTTRARPEGAEASTPTPAPAPGPARADADSVPAVPSVPSLADAADDDDITRVGDIPSVRPEEEPAEPAHASSSLPRTMFELNADLGFDEPTGPHARILTSAASLTDVGRKRRRNEDSLFVDDEAGLYVVADGMGGYAGGDIASSIAVDVLRRSFDDTGRFVGEKGAADPKRPAGANEVAWAIERANVAIRRRAEEDETFQGMGTTVVAARFSRRRQRVFIAHVGDSRCYRIRNGLLTPLTSDHTLARSGMTGPLAGRLSRALGAGPTVKVDVLIDAPEHGDRYLLCSDGLSRMIADDAIAKIVGDGATLDDQVQRLIAHANEAGGRDNVTVVVVKIHDPLDPTFERTSQKQRLAKLAAESLR